MVSRASSKFMMYLELQGKLKHIISGSPWLAYMDSLALYPNTKPPYDATAEELFQWYIPTCPSLLCRKVDWQEVETKDSAAAPRLCMFSTVPVYHLQDKCHMADGSIQYVLWKGEDLRRDQIIICIIKLIDHILKRELNIETIKNLPIITYRVVPTSPDAGLIEVIRGAKLTISVYIL